jgi:hypothetical protein
MPFTAGKTAKGWGVYRPAPWHFAGIYPSKERAEAKAQELGPQYATSYGEHQVGTDNFVGTAAT